MSARFLSPLRFEDDNGLPFTLTDALEYQSDVLGSRITVPAGFQTDLASIPRALWNVLPPVGSYDRAAVIHDQLYQTGVLSYLSLGMRIVVRPVSRAEADAVLREAMIVCGVPTWQRTAIWLGVRVGGFAVWGTYRRRVAAALA